MEERRETTWKSIVVPFSLRFGRCHFTIVLKEKFTIILKCVLYVNVYLFTVFVIEVFGGG